MAKCKFPIHVINSDYRTGKRNGCDTRGRFEITYQGRRILVCKVHKQFDGRDNPY